LEEALGHFAPSAVISQISRTALAILADSSEAYQRRHELVEEIGRQLAVQSAAGPLTKQAKEVIEKAIAAEFRCYAGILHLRHGDDPTRPGKHTNSGYASRFEQPALFEG